MSSFHSLFVPFMIFKVIVDIMMDKRKREVFLIGTEVVFCDFQLSSILLCCIPAFQASLPAFLRDICPARSNFTSGVVFVKRQYFWVESSSIVSEI